MAKWLTVLALAWYGADRPSAESLIAFVGVDDADRGYRRRFGLDDDDL